MTKPIFQRLPGGGPATYTGSSRPENEVAQRFIDWLGQFPQHEWPRRIDACNRLLAHAASYLRTVALLGQHVPRGSTLEDIRAALEEGAWADTYSSNYKYPTLLCVAAVGDDLELVRLLAAHGAWLDNTDGDDTPLGAAHFQESFDAAALLLELGARLDLVHGYCDVFRAALEGLGAYEFPRADPDGPEAQAGRLRLMDAFESKGAELSADSRDEVKDVSGRYFGGLKAGAHSIPGVAPILAHIDRAFDRWRQRHLDEWDAKLPPAAETPAVSRARF